MNARKQAITAKTFTEFCELFFIYTVEGWEQHLAVPAESEQQQTPNIPAETPPAAVPATGRRLAFQNIARQLTPEEMASPGTQKVILDLLITTEAERDEYKAYVGLYHKSDKQCGVLEEKNKCNKVNEILFGVGVGVGCGIMGLAPFFWEPKSQYGVVCLVVGAVLTVGSTIGRIVFK